MHNISINNLFGETENNKQLNVYSLCNTKMDKDKEKINLNIDRLIHLRNERKNKVLVHYEKAYESCVRKITEANEINKTDLIHTVLDISSLYPDFSLINCVEHIKNKLDELKLDVVILTHNTIYISWLNLDKNIKDSKT